MSGGRRNRELIKERRWKMEVWLEAELMLLLMKLIMWKTEFKLFLSFCVLSDSDEGEMFRWLRTELESGARLA